LSKKGDLRAISIKNTKRDKRKWRAENAHDRELLRPKELKKYYLSLARGCKSPGRNSEVGETVKKKETPTNRGFGKRGRIK